MSPFTKHTVMRKGSQMFTTGGIPGYQRAGLVNLRAAMCQYRPNFSKS